MNFASPLQRVWSTRRADFVSFRDAAASLHEETRAAEMLLQDLGTAPSPDACRDYHARQLLDYAKYGKVTLYGRRGRTGAMEPISRNTLWTGKSADDMGRWVSDNGIEYAELSVRRRELRRVMDTVRQSVKDHDVLLAWCRRHAHADVVHR